jgi:hypothetical protein
MHNYECHDGDEGRYGQGHEVVTDVAHADDLFLSPNRQSSLDIFHEEYPVRSQHGPRDFALQKSAISTLPVIGASHECRAAPTSLS